MIYKIENLIQELNYLVGDFYNCGLDYPAQALEKILRRYDKK